MYSVVLLMAMSGGADVPAGLFGGHGCCGGKHHGGSGCCGGYGGCYGGGCYGSSYGCCGGGKHHGGRGCCGGGHGMFGGRGHGCCGGKHHGGHGCCGGYSCHGGYGYSCSGGACYGSGYGCTGGYGYSCSGGAGCYGSGMGYGCTGGAGCWGGAGYGCTGGAGCYGAGAGAGCVGGAPAMGAPVIGTPVNTGTPVVPEKVKKPMTSLAAPATIVVSLPAEAKLLIDDAATASKSAQRVFVSPTLNPGRDYHYTLKAEWMRDGKAVSMTREIAVRAGEETRVQFAAEQPASVASR